MHHWKGVSLNFKISRKIEQSLHFKKYGSKFKIIIIPLWDRPAHVQRASLCICLRCSPNNCTVFCDLFTSLTPPHICHLLIYSTLSSSLLLHTVYHSLVCLIFTTKRGQTTFRQIYTAVYLVIWILVYVDSQRSAYQDMLPFCVGQTDKRLLRPGSPS